MTDLRAVSATTGEPIGDPLLLNRLERKRPLTRPEIDEWLADHATAIRFQTASTTLEIAAQLRQELRDLEILHSGTWDERLEAIAVELVQSDDGPTILAGKLVEIALLIMRSPT